MSTSVELDTAGTVWKLMVKNGDTVESGDTLFIMEVMKMEVPYEAAAAGTVTDLVVAEGDVVEEGLIALRVV